MDLILHYAKAFVAFAIPAAAALAMYLPESADEGKFAIGIASAVVAGLLVARVTNRP